jgi:hypothetical protein
MKRRCLQLLVAVAAGCGEPPAIPPDASEPALQLPASVMAQIDTLLADKGQRTPAQRKISSALLYAHSGRFAAALARTRDPAKQIVSLTETDDHGRVLVDLRGPNVASLGGAVAAAGGSVVDSQPRNLRAWLALDKLEALAGDPAVDAIHPALAATTWRADRTLPAALAASLAGPGAAVSEGDRAHAADRARQYFGVDGTGVTIGVLSDSDDGKEQAIATGDLPAGAITVPGQDGRPRTGEGSVVMQIVHDLAPGAQLVFATAFNGPESFANNIRALRFVYHCDVIVDDVLYFFESPYEDDIIAQAVEDVTNDGAAYFSSAGNNGNLDDGTAGTWEGDFQPAGALATLPSGYTVHSFGNGAVADRIEGFGGPLVLHWADPGHLDDPASANDYDLFVLDNDLRNVVLASTDIQDGSGLAFEFLSFGLPPGYRVVVAAAPGAAPRALHTVLFRGELAIATSGATYGHNSTAGGYGVAAVDVFEASGGELTGGPTTPVEIFSSDGPRRVFYDRHNQPIVPSMPGGTFASHAGVTRDKPDITAADGVTTASPLGSTFNPFFGTSAAAPHAAAIAGLAKAALPGLTPAQLRQAIASGAIDIGPPGADRNTGRGIISAYDTLVRAGAIPMVTLATGELTVIPRTGSVLGPGGSAQLMVQLQNTGGASATAVSAALTSTSPLVTITQGGSGYPSMPSQTTASNTTPFAFNLAASAPCGAVLPFTLTVSYAGNGPHPASLGFTVQVGRAAQTAHFAYAGPPVAIPDGSAAGVSVALPVVFTGGIARLVVHLDGTACTAAVGATTVGIDHTWVGDLTLALTSPTGRTATLVDAPGGFGNSGNHFCQTALDDAAPASIQQVTIDDAPFTGAFRPVQPLSVFAGDSANGTWLLRATDSATGDTGHVRAFSIDVTGFSCGP